MAFPVIVRGIVLPDQLPHLQLNAEEFVWPYDSLIVPLLFVTMTLTESDDPFETVTLDFDRVNLGFCLEFTLTEIFVEASCVSVRESNR